MGQPIVPTEQDFEDIQGNILGGFNQDAQTFLFFTIPHGCRVKHWLAEIVDDIASTSEVLANNRAFKARTRQAGRVPEAEAEADAVFMNIAFTQKGLAAVGVSDADLAAMPEEFRERMRARAAELGDIDDSAPSNWLGRFASEDPHVALILAADREQRLHELVLHHLALAASHGLHLMHLQTGHTRVDQPGHPPNGRLEHAEGEASQPQILHALQSATKSMELARGRLRYSEPEVALDSWKGRVAARWTLVDRFERDGRRYIIARENASRVSGRDHLTERERQVVASAALGRSYKEIAYDLGLADATVRVLFARAAKKLGARSKREALLRFTNQ